MILNRGPYTWEVSCRSNYNKLRHVVDLWIAKHALPPELAPLLGCVVEGTHREWINASVLVDRIAEAIDAGKLAELPGYDLLTEGDRGALEAWVAAKEETAA